MPRRDTLPKAEYEALRDQIAGILDEGKLESRQDSAWRKVESYWHIGDALLIGVFSRAERTAYGQQTVANIAKELNLRRDELYDFLAFRKALPIVGNYRQLNWSHFRKIIRLPNQDQRYYYARLANDEGWTADELTTRIKEETYRTQLERPFAVDAGEDPFAGRPLRARHGQLHTYRLVRSQLDPDDLLIDLGFGMRCKVPLTGLDEPQPGMTVTSRRARKQYRFEQTRTRHSKLWTYVAHIERVVDGDTLIAVIDCGFGHETAPLRLRLRGIDTPELRFKAGARARGYVIEVLSEVEFLIVTTRKTDTYGRWLADITYLPAEGDPHRVLEKGIYLNRELLQQRLAVRYVD